MNDKRYAWTVVGAGPAGIAALGLLLDNGINPSEILWIDPSFTVGDFGEHWYAVSSNTSVKLFMDFLTNIKAFEYDQHQASYVLDTMEPSDTCALRYVAEPLQWVTNRLKKKVVAHKTTVTHLSRNLGHWSLETANLETFHSEKIILATGATPKTLNYVQYCQHEISVRDALKPAVLEQCVNKEDTIAIFGSSHSAMIILRDLVNLGIKKVLNFYHSPIKFSLQLDGWILYDNTGLKGNTAQWVKQNIFEQRLSMLHRYVSNERNIQRHLPLCDKVIYAVGFKRRIPISVDINLNSYDVHSGIIAPGLFGTGVGFPKQVMSPMGHIEMNVGLWKFMQDMRIMMPVWLQYGA